MGLIDRLRSVFTPVPVEERDGWWMNFNGNSYPIGWGLNQTLVGQKEEVGGDFLGLGNGHRGQHRHHHRLVHRDGLGDRSQGH